MLALPFAALLLLTSGAHAQREVAEDGWPEARETLGPIESDTSPSSPLLAPIPPRRQRQRETREVELGRLAAGAARARSHNGGPLRVRLRGPRGLDWMWLGRAEEPPWRFGFTQGLSICRTECTLYLTPGSYRFGIRNPSLVGAVAEDLAVDRPGTIVAHYESMNQRRRGGIALVVLGFLTGVVGAIGGLISVLGFCDLELETCENNFPRYVKVPFWTGLAAIAVGITLLITSGRRVRLEFVPGGAARSPAPSTIQTRARARGDASASR